MRVVVLAGVGFWICAVGCGSVTPVTSLVGDGQADEHERDAGSVGDAADGAIERAPVDGQAAQLEVGDPVADARGDGAGGVGDGQAVDGQVGEAGPVRFACPATRPTNFHACPGQSKCGTCDVSNCVDAQGRFCVGPVTGTCDDCADPAPGPGVTCADLYAAIASPEQVAAAAKVRCASGCAVCQLAGGRNLDFCQLAGDYCVPECNTCP